MAKFTNTAPGARGITMNDGQTQLVEAGATVDRDPKDIKEMHPDIVKGDGIKVHQADVPNDEIAGLTARAETAENALAAANDEIAGLKAKLDETSKLKAPTKA